MSLENCNEDILEILKSYDCDIETTYDVSHVRLVDNESSETMSLSSNGMSLPELSFDNEEVDNSILSAKRRIEETLDRYNVRMESTYDYSSVFIFDSHGQRESF